MDTLIGEVDLLKVISKVRSKKEGWVTTVKAMEIPDVGCMVTTLTQKGGESSQSTAFIPGVDIQEVDGNLKLVAVVVIP